MRINHTDRPGVETLSANLREALCDLYEPGRPPSDPRVAFLLRQVRCGRNNAVDIVASLYVCAVRDKRPPAKLAAFARALAAFVERAPTPTKPLPLLHRIETQKDAAFDLSQVRALTDGSRESLRDCLERLRDYRAFLGEMEHALEREVYRIPPQHPADLAPPSAA